MTEYSYAAYRDLLDDLRAAGYEFGAFDGPPDEGTVVLRHDVDWSPERAARMAAIEADRGVTATYFVLVTSPLYNVLTREVRDAIETIESLGHRVGVHVSTHQYWDDDPGDEAVAARVREEQAVLDTVVDDVAEAVSFHIPPEWVLGVDYDGFTSAYAPAYFEEVAYVADSTQRWRAEPPFEGAIPDRLQVLVHPGAWAETDQGFLDRLDAERERRFDAVRASLDDQYVSAVDDPPAPSPS